MYQSANSAGQAKTSIQRVTKPTWYDKPLPPGSILGVPQNTRARAVDACPESGARVGMRSAAKSKKMQMAHATTKAIVATRHSSALTAWDATKHIAPKKCHGGGRIATPTPHRRPLYWITINVFGKPCGLQDIAGPGPDIATPARGHRSCTNPAQQTVHAS